MIIYTGDTSEHFSPMAARTRPVTLRAVRFRGRRDQTGRLWRQRQENGGTGGGGLVVIYHLGERCPLTLALFDLHRGETLVLKWKNSRTAGQDLATQGHKPTQRDGAIIYRRRTAASIGEPQAPICAISITDRLMESLIHPNGADVSAQAASQTNGPSLGRFCSGSYGERAPMCP